MTDSSTLTDQQRRVVSWVAAGMPGPHAFTRAGYSKSYAKKAAKVLRRPAFAAALEAERAMLREQVPYDAPAAVREIDRQIALALSARNHNYIAAAKNLDLKCRIFGLVKEKLEITTVDLKGALEAARSRILNIITPQREGSDLAVSGARWPPRVPGDSVSTNQEE